MKSNKMFFIISGMFISFSAHAVGPRILPSIGVVGPQGEVIAYEKVGEEIVIRQCAKNTLVSEIGASGCVLKEGTVEVRLNEKDFKRLVQQKLSTLGQDEKGLSPEQKALLDRSLIDLPKLDEEIKKLDDLKKKLQKNQAFKVENPEDYDAAEERDLNSQIGCIESRLSEQKDIVQAKRDVEDIVAGLIRNMDGKRVEQVLKHSKDRGGIAFNLLKELAAIKGCDFAQDAKVGEICVTSKRALFTRVERVSADGKSWGKAWKDPSGMIWSERLGNANHYAATDQCTKLGGTLPSKEDFERLKNYVNLKDNGFLSDKGRAELFGIMPDMQDHWFWSSSVFPNSTYDAYVFGGGYGVIGNGVRNYDNGSVRCVGR